jgi:glutamate 5-kinase
VIKVGSGVLTREGQFHGRTLSRLAREIAALVDAGRQVVLVSSGAVALGVDAMGLKARPRDIPGLQAAAAVGQARLMDRWSRAFAHHGRQVAQVLLTHADVDDRRRYLNARHTLLRLLAEGVVPIINENDSVSVEEIRLGDNDLLAGLVVGLCGAEALILLTDIDGLYDDDPRRNPAATRLDEVRADDPRLAHFAGKSRSGVGTGGMVTKVRSARMAGELGVGAVIGSGRRTGVLGRIATGEIEGTAIASGQARRLTGRKSWLVHATRPKGRLVVDAGARRALMENGRSLLPSGVQAVEGRFGEGDPVEITDDSGAVFALGLVVYDAEAVRKIAGKRTTEIEAILGYRTLDEVVHRDDLALTAPAG